MKYSMMAEASPKTVPESHVMLAAKDCSNATSNSYSAGDDEGRSRTYSQHENIIAPKVRVVYVYEPKIIKTDRQNFQSLVQRLTGKSSHKLKEKKRQTNHNSPSSEVIVAEVGSENLEYTFYSNDQSLIMENKTTKFLNGDCSGFSKGFSTSTDMDQGFADEIPLIFPDLVDQGLSSEVIAAEVGTENPEYTFYCNDQLPITEKYTTNLTEDCSGFSKRFTDMDMIFPSLMNQGLHRDEIPLVWNDSPFCNMYDQAAV